MAVSKRRHRRRRTDQLALGGVELGDELGWAERWARREGCERIVGVDEAGRGPIAGPVVAAAVALPAELERELRAEGLNDSKQLTSHLREVLSQRIQRGAWVEIGVVSASRIDEVNILVASLEAMRLAVTGLAEQLDAPPDLLLVDGRDPIHPSPLPGVRQQPLIQGDARSVCIAAASVVAKVHRDRLMIDYDAEYPGYGFTAHKGYGCRDHYEALAALGPSPIHRRSFRGVGGGTDSEAPDQLLL
jgi:ribonuclease HII